MAFLEIEESCMAKLFPVILIFLDLGAAVVYLWNGEYAKSVYWGAAAVLNWSILWM